MQNAYIGIMADESPDLLVGLMGVMKSGNCFIPLSPNLPDERVRLIINDCRISLVLSDRSQYERLCGLRQACPSLRHILCLDIPYRQEDEDSADDEEEGKIGRVEAGSDSVIDDFLPASESACYVIYTSGSTGLPKGVVISHANVMPLFLWSKDYFGFNEQSRVAQNLSYTFDFGIFELLSTIVFGGTLFFLKREDRFNPECLVQFIQEHGINTIHSTPSFFSTVVSLDRKMPSLKIVHLGGEVLSPKLARQILNLTHEACTLYNGYGPTETSVTSNIYAIQAEKNINLPAVIPIGKPSANNRLYVLDPEDHVMPLGFAGELCISGDGVAMGYLNRPGLTAERFVPDPFQPHARMYRSGDLVRWLPDGNIEYIGRIDSQVKIRGHRIELGEIENCLLQHEQIDKAVVLDIQDETAGKYLCAYYVSADPLRVDVLREYIGKKLPVYMIPEYFIHLNHIPLNQNGKLDRKALPVPDRKGGMGRNDVQPRDELERRLAAIWEDVLMVKPIGLRSHFFELGGQSIKVIKLINAIHKNLDVRLSIQDVFANATIEKLKAVIQSRKAGIGQQIEPLATQNSYRLSFAQNRIWILTQITRDADAYNVPARFPVQGAIDPETLQELFRKLTDRHESLRIRFEQTADGPAQIIEPAVPVAIAYADLTGFAEGARKEKARELYLQLQKTAFDLRTLPLFRLIFVRYEKEQGELFVAMHHIITDAWSMDILQKELLALLEARWSGGDAGLPALTATYKDFAAWQQRRFDDEGGTRAAHDFWRHSLAEPYTPLNLPTLRPDWSKSGPGAAHKVFIPETEADLLKVAASRKQTTLFILMLAGLYGYLHSLTNQEDIVVGTAVSGRTHDDLQNVVGYFVNTIPLRMTVEKKKSIWEILTDTHALVLQALQYQDFPLEKLSEELQAPLPGIQVLLNGVNIAETAREWAEDIGSFHLDIQNVKFPLQLFVTEYRNGLELIVTYMKELFEAATVEYMVQEYIRFTVDAMQQIAEKEIIRPCS